MRSMRSMHPPPPIHAHTTHRHYGRVDGVGHHLAAHVLGTVGAGDAADAPLLIEHVQGAAALVDDAAGWGWGGGVCGVG